MKKLIFFVLLILQGKMVISQCSAGYLGTDRTAIACSNPFVFNHDNLNDLFNVWALNPTYKIDTLPPTDTIPGIPFDTVRYYIVKLRIIATTASNCKDTALIRVPYNLDPLPNIGRDTSLIVCRGIKVDLLPFYHSSSFPLVWSTPTPGSVDAGNYTVQITTRDGCKDTAFISITNFPYISLGPDSNVTAKPGQTFNLFKLVDTAHLTITWNTPNPAAAPIGLYWAVGVDSNNCRDTAFVEICKKPDMGHDTTIKVCTGLTRSLYGVYTLTGLDAVFSTSTPSAVGPGNYQLIVTNYCGGKDTVLITVVAAAKPNAGIDDSFEICVNETLNLDAIRPLPGLTKTWSISDPTHAPAGTHRLIATNAEGCTDTAFLTVTPTPRLPYLNDTTVYVCGSQTKNLNLIYPIPEDAFAEWVNISNAAQAPIGTYTLSVDHQGCIYEIHATVASEATRNASISLCTYNTGSAPFSTNAFRSVVVDKDGNIWAGADGNGSAGGVYRFVRTGSECNQGSWSAATPFANSSFRDLHVSPVVGDKTIWCASNGYNAVEAITGGVYKINSLASISRFGSALDANGSLSSRWVYGLAIAPNKKLYAGLSVSQTAANVIGEGDVFEYDLNTMPADFSKSPMFPGHDENRRITCVGMRGTELWIGSQQNCNNGTCIDPFILRWNTTTNTSIGAVSQLNSPIPFTDNPSIIIRAIFTSSTGKTFIGLNLGLGFAVLEPDVQGQPAKWTLLNYDNSAFPQNGSVNFNAITEVNGEIWIGTTQGLLVYNGVGSLTDCKSYTLYNTSNGLVSNNVTDIAYDVAHQEVWITHSAGVSKVTKSFSVSGRVLNVFCGKYKNDLQPKIFNRPIEGASVTLLNSSNAPVDAMSTNALGEFNLKNAVAGQTYKVRVLYKTFTYEYSAVSPNEYIGDVLLPDSLIKELVELRDTMKTRDVKFTLPGQQTFSLIWTVPPFKVDGIDVTNFNKAWEAYSGTISDNHKKRIENLAIYYVTLATINDIGNSATDLVSAGIEMAVEVATGMAEFAGSLKELQDFQALWKQLGSDQNTSPGLKEQAIEEVNKLILDAQIECFKQVSSISTKLLGENLRAKLDDGGKLVYDAVKATIDQVADQIIMDLKGEEGVANLTPASFKKLIVKVVTEAFVKTMSVVYYKYYCRIKHAGLVNDISIDTRDALSEKTYTDVYRVVYDKGFVQGNDEPSINKKAIDIAESANDQIEIEKAVAESSSTWASITKAASSIALESVLLAEAAPILRVFSVALEGLSLGLKTVAMGTSLIQGVRVGNLSDGVLEKTGFPVILQQGPQPNDVCSAIDNSAFKQAGQNYTQRLREFQLQLRQPFDTIPFARGYKALVEADHAFGAAIDLQLNAALARYNNAVAQIPGFDDQLSRTISGPLGLQAGYRASFLMESISYILNPNKVYNTQKLIPLIDTIIANNFAAIAALNNITTTLNTYCIPANAYLVKTEFNDSTTHKWGTKGYFVYSFTNFGTVAQNQVNFTLEQPGGGFTITSPLVVSFSSILPGQTVSAKFNYELPSKDTSVTYTLKITAANGRVQDEQGSLIALRAVDNVFPITVKAGSWHDPNTWDTGQVPSSISQAIITHNVSINSDATCKTLKVKSPAQVQVAAGKKLTILQ